jgi:hypothetical protein
MRGGGGNADVGGAGSPQPTAIAAKEFSHWPSWSMGLPMLRLAKDLNLHRIAFKTLWRHTAAAILGASIVVFAARASAPAQTPSTEQAPAKNKDSRSRVDEFGWLAYGVHWFDRRRGWVAAGSGRIQPIRFTAMWTALDR